MHRCTERAPREAEGLVSREVIVLVYGLAVGTGLGAGLARRELVGRAVRLIALAHLVTFALLEATS